MKRVLIAILAVTTMAVVARANNGGGPGHGGPEGGFGGEAIVASDGTIFITDTVIDTGTRTSTTTIKAVSPSGAVMWSATFSNIHRLRLSDGNLISESEATASDGTVSSTLTAISVSSGTTSWTRTLAGRVASLEPFSGGTYAIVVVAATTSAGSASRSLVAISNSGAVLWTLSL